MGLSAWVVALAVRRAHVLIIEVPGETLLRLRTEAFVANAGWTVATSPADADVLLVCGRAEGETLARVDRLWDQMVAPRVRLSVESPVEIPHAVRNARLALLDGDAQRIDAAARAMTTQSAQHALPESPSTLHDHGGRSSGSNGSVDTAHDSSRQETVHASMPAADQSTGHASMDTGNGHPMDMDMDMDMSGPAGIPLAQGEDDRDGLEMDALHVSLGPVLLAWPSDLVLRCTLHGDVIAAAEAELVPVTLQPASMSSDERSALLVDAAARVMLLAGWDAAATALRRVRDDLLSSCPDRNPTARRLGRVSRRIRRSRTVRWSLGGIRSRAMPARAADPDVHQLLLDLLEHASNAVQSAEQDDHREFQLVSEAGLAAAVVGHDLAAARLIVAARTPWGTVGGPTRASHTGGAGD